MPKIKLSHVVSCSSEDPANPAENLLHSDPKKKFLCKTKGESSVSVILQLEKTSKICSIDIGNANSAFVELFVGRSSSQSSQEKNYEILLPMSSFMTPMDAMNMTNSNRVRLFTTDDLTSPTKDDKWDRVKIICTQPFNKTVQFGLSFITLNTKETSDEDTNLNLGKFTVRPESPNLLQAGSLFSKRKELTQDVPKKTIAQEIRAADTVTPSSKICIKQSTSKNKKAPDNNDVEIKKQMNRNRRDIFYDSDDDKNTEKIDKVVEKVKEEQNKKLDKKEKIAEKYKDTPPKKNATPERKRKTQTNENTHNKRQKITRKPFNQLLDNVVFTISGFVNPERGNIRQNGLNMGAKYRRDWDATCTHLICAFANTPKFQQVHGKGKIVKKEWLQDCNTQRKRLPWRRYALDRTDASRPESEDEIYELVDEPSTSRSDYLSGSDTDEEIEKIINLQQKTVETSKEKEKPKTPIKEFDVETDEEPLEKNPKNIPDIPKLFETEIFYIDPVFPKNEMEKLERLIKSFNGVIIKRISSIIDYVITNEDSVKNVKNEIDGAKFVTKEWIFECHDQMVLVPHEKYLL